MTYAMTLDNSWELMSEEEMYDVNGGGLFDKAINKAIDFVKSGVAWTLVALGAKMTFTQIYAGLSLIAGWKDVLVAIKLAFWDFRVLAGVVLVAAGMAMAVFL